MTACEYATTAQKLGYKTAAMLILNNPYGIGLGDSFPDRFAKVGGTVTGKVIYNPNQSSYRSEIQQALSGKPDVILFGGYTPDGIQVFKEWFQLGLGGTWMAPASRSARSSTRATAPAPPEATGSGKARRNLRPPRTRTATSLT